MWLNLSGEASSWQEALTPHLEIAERWLRSQLRNTQDPEEALAEALAMVCLDASRGWRLGTGLRLSLVYPVRHVRAGRMMGGLGLGWGHRNHRVRTRNLPAGWEESVHGRELSPVQGAEWGELKESLPGLLSLAAERLVSGDQFKETAELVGVHRTTLRRAFQKHLERFLEE